MGNKSAYINLSIESESDLWKSFVDKNENAFSHLYKKCYKSLYNYGINLGMTEELVEDAIQDLFLKLYSRPNLINDPLTIRAFLFRSIKNFFINSLKKEDKNSSLEESDPELPFFFDYAIDERLIKEDEEDEMKQKIDKILASLSPRQREIIYFRFLHGMEYEEISRIMNISGQSARNLLHKAFEKVRKSYGSVSILLLLKPI